MNTKQKNITKKIGTFILTFVVFPALTFAQFNSIQELENWKEQETLKVYEEGGEKIKPFIDELNKAMDKIPNMVKYDGYTMEEAYSIREEKLEEYRVHEKEVDEWVKKEEKKIQEQYEEYKADLSIKEKEEIPKMENEKEEKIEKNLDDKDKEKKNIENKINLQNSVAIPDVAPYLISMKQTKTIRKALKVFRNVFEREMNKKETLKEQKEMLEKTLSRAMELEKTNKVIDSVFLSRFVYELLGILGNYIDVLGLEHSEINV